MPALSLFFKVHQPYCLKRFTSLDIDASNSYEDPAADQQMIHEAAELCYMPANNIIHSLVRRFGGKFKLSFSISGVLLELLQRYRPDVINSFRQLVNTGCVDILAETYFNSTCFLHSPKEFQRQVIKHGNLVKKIFGISPTVFRNTELIHNNELAGFIAGLGYKGILCDGVTQILGHKSSNRVYAAPGVAAGFGLLLRNAALSDSIAFRFDEPGFELTAEKFAGWVHQHPHDTEVVNLFMDYETFGMHKKKQSGIFEFLQEMPGKVLSDENWSFQLPKELLAKNSATDTYDVPQWISWEQSHHISGIWGENVRQNNMLKKIYGIEKMVMASGSEKAMDTWGRFQAADYFHQMDAFGFFQSYSNMLTDFEIGLIRKGIEKNKKLHAFRSMAAGLL